MGNEGHPVQFCAVLKGYPVPPLDSDAVQSTDGEFAASGRRRHGGGEQQALLVGVVQLGKDTERAGSIASWARLVRLELCPMLRGRCTGTVRVSL